MYCDNLFLDPLDRGETELNSFIFYFIYYKIFLKIYF
jgi:hypothetical protein